MAELPITGDRLLSIWWALLWRVWAASCPVVIILSLVGRFVPGIHIITELGSLIFLLIWNFVALGMALKAKYTQFRIVLVPLEP